jgi:methionyl-tRNA synthetase
MSSTEYLNYESGKFSKSRGIGVFGTDVMETEIPADVWRFYIFYNRPEKSDSLFTWKDFGEKVNSELIGNLGNLVNRTLSFVTRYYGGKIPAGAAGSGAFWGKVREYEKDITEKLDRADERDAFRAIFELSSFANKTFQDAEPWKKRTQDPPAAESLIRDLSYVVRDLAVLIQPYMPQAAEQIASFFGLSFGKDLVYKKSAPVLSWDSIGKPLGLSEVVKSEVLFAKLEDDKIAELRDRYSGSQKEREDAKAGAAANAGLAQSVAASEVLKEPQVPQEPWSLSEPLDIRFAKTLDLRVAKIVKIERHPKADKLYIETLEIAGADGANEERIIVSGLVPFYKEEELLNKHIIVAYNLKPAKLRGVESRGMLLAASDHKGPPNEQGEGTERVEVLDAGDTPTGTRVSLDSLDLQAAPAEIDIDTFFSIPIEVKDNTVTVGGRAFTLNNKPVHTVTISQGEVH